MHKIRDLALPIPTVKSFTLVQSTSLIVSKCSTQARLSVCQIFSIFFLFHCISEQTKSWLNWRITFWNKETPLLWSLHKLISPVVQSWSNKNSVSIILAFSPSNLMSGASFHLFLIYSWWMGLFSTYIWQKCIVLSKLPCSLFPHKQRHFH